MIKKYIFLGYTPDFAELIRQLHFFILFTVQIMKLFFPAAYKNKVLKKHGRHTACAGRDFFQFPSAGKRLPGYCLLH